MIGKHLLKTTLVSLIIMGLAAGILLLGLSALTYTLKWQVAQVMIGIIFAYIISGFIGGMVQGVLSKGGVGNKELMISKQKDSIELKDGIIRGFLLGTGYMLVLLILSIALKQNANWDMIRIIMIWILVACSSVLGVVSVNIFYKKR